MIEEEEKGNLKIFTLSEGDNEVQINVNPGKEWVAYFKSSTYDFKELVGDKDSRNEIKDVLQEKLDFRTEGKVKLAGLFKDEFSLVLLEGSELHIGEKWAEEERQIHP